ncbi:MAG: sulfatase-like hydrolase/transferase [Bacteroidia bacterium]|nr:sulfatase-like hydrolase/transferase [Bacteroidia bacterium]MCO5254611.1 sulfatase-like hydrolase/transferase [Bacteroidota bacterium]
MKRNFTFFLIHYFVILIGAAIARTAFLLRNIRFADNTGETLASFWHGLPLDIALASYAFVPALILFNLLNKKYIKTALTLFYIIVQSLSFFINSLDAELFVHWGTRVNMMALFYSQHLGDAFASVDLSILGMFILTLTTQMVVFNIFIKNVFVYIANLWSQDKRFNWLSTLTILVLLMFSVVLMRGGVGKVPINQSRVVYSSNPFLNAASINGLWNLFYYVLNKSDRVKYEDYKFVDDRTLEGFCETHFQTGQPIEPALFDSKIKPNIILLMMESLSAETLPGIGGTYDWSPNINRLMDSVWVFSRMYASGNRTDKGLAALLSGFPAQPSTSVLLEPEKASALPSISCMLSKQGYHNTFIYGGDISFANMGYYLQNICFDVIIDKDNISSKTAKGAWGYHDQDIFAALKTQIQHQRSNFFISTLSLSVHEPYDIPVNKSGNKKMKAAYKYSDSCVADFVQWFQQSEYYANTILIITGDHGRDVGIDYGQFFAKQKFQIPAIVLGGALNPFYKGKKMANLTSQTALMPFILQNLHYSVSAFPFYHNPVSGHPFAIYFFDNGFGLITPDEFVAWNNPTQELTSYEPKTQALEEFEKEANFGRTYQQILMKKFFDLIRK